MSSAAYYQEHKAELRPYHARKQAENRQRRRRAVVDALGGTCSCSGCRWHQGPCGLSDDALLEIDHVNGGGNVQRGAGKGYGRSVGQMRYYRDLLSMVPSGELRLLCANCHRIVSDQRAYVQKKQAVAA